MKSIKQTGSDKIYQLVLCIFVFVLFSLAQANDCFSFQNPKFLSFYQQDSTPREHGDRKEKDAWLGTDKIEHFVVSSFLAGVSYKIYHEQYNNPKESSLYFSTVFTLSIGISKEILDHKRREGKFSVKDLVFDIAGIGFGLLLAVQ